MKVVRIVSCLTGKVDDAWRPAQGGGAEDVHRLRRRLLLRRFARDTGYRRSVK